MQKIKTFFRTFFLSCTSPKYYADVLKSRFSFSVKYFVFLQFLTSLAIASLIIIPLSAFDLSSLLNSVKDAYPSNLAISVEDGRLSVNQPLPYKIPVPADMYDDEYMGEASEGPDVRYLAVFESDESVTGAMDVLQQDSLVVLTESTIYMRDDSRGGLRVYPIPTGESFEINPAMVDQLFSMIVNNAFVKNKLYIPFIAAIFMLIVFPMMIIGGLIVSAIYGFFVWLMAKIFSGALLAGAALTYTKSVQVTFHSMTLITVVQTVLRVLGEGHRLEGGWYLLAFLVWTGFVLHQAHHQTHSTASAPAVKAAPKSVSRVTSRKPARKGKK